MKLSRSASTSSAALILLAATQVPARKLRATSSRASQDLPQKEDPVSSLSSEKYICMHDLFPTCQEVHTPEGKTTGIMCFTVVDNELNVKIQASEDYAFVRYNYWLGNSDEMPLKKDGDPHTNKFPHFWSNNEGDTEATWALDVAHRCPEDGSDLVVNVATHAIMGPVAKNGNVDRGDEFQVFAGREMSSETGYFDLLIHCNCPEEL